MSIYTLIILIIALYVFFRIFALYIAPFLIKLFIRRVQKKFYENNSHMNRDSNTKSGKVTIHRMKDSKDNDIPSDLGEYIDYEEVKNNQNPANE